MGCVNANIGNKGGCLAATVGRVGSNLKAAISLSDETLIAAISRIGQGLKATIGIVCTPAVNPSDAYLRVSPEVIWLTPDMGSSGVFTVKANVRWEIVLEKQEEDEQIVGILTNGALITNDTMLINGVTVSILANSVNIDNNTL